jgi:hypothetical protein
VHLAWGWCSVRREERKELEALARTE